MTTEVFEKPLQYSDKAIEVITSAVEELTLPKDQIELAKAKQKMKEMTMEILMLKDRLKIKN